jgi:hypothetical protein
MHVPGPRERVRQRGRPGLFLVISVDCDEQSADLVRLDTDCAWLEEGVPFQELQPWQDRRDSRSVIGSHDLLVETN